MPYQVLALDVDWEPVGPALEFELQGIEVGPVAILNDAAKALEARDGSTDDFQPIDPGNVTLIPFDRGRDTGWFFIVNEGHYDSDYYLIRHL